jgi:hypothetical protein
MEVLINNETVDITLEEEKNLGDLLSGITKWLEDGKLHIQTVDINGTPLDFSNQSWKSRSLNDIEKLSIEASTESIIRAEAYQTGLELLETFRITALEGRKEEILNLKDVLIESLRDLLEEMNQKALISSLHHILDQEDFTGPLSEYLSSLMIILEERVRELLQPFLELQNLDSLMKRITQELEETPVLLQTGQEKQAINSVLRFIELSEKAIRLFRILSTHESKVLDGLSYEEVDFTDFYLDFNTSLGELEEALGNQDTVLIGDLLEYEVVPRLDTLSRFTQKILREGKKD